MYPVLEIVGVRIALYGLMLACGVSLALALGFGILRHRHEDADGFLVLCGYAMLGALIGAKILYLATVWDELELSRALDPSYPLSLISPGGFVFFGGLIGGAIGMSVGAVIHDLPLLRLLNQVIFVLPLAHGFGRIGCLLGGCCYGIPYEGMLEIRFPEDSFAGSMPRFPLQSVCAFILWGLALVLYAISRSKFKHYGAFLYLVCYCALRFVMEFLRGDALRGIWAGLSLSQWICLALLLTAGGYAVITPRQCDIKSYFLKLAKLIS